MGRTGIRCQSAGRPGCSMERADESVSYCSRFVLDKNAPFLPRGQFKADPTNLETPQTYSWNLALQHQIQNNWLVSASYLATRTLHIWTMNALNPAAFIPGTCSAGQYGLAAPGACSTTANTDARRILSLERPADGDKIGPLGQM